MKVLAELLNAKPREIRSFLSGHLAPGRTQELQSELLAAGSLFRRPQNQTANLLDRRIVKMDLQVVEAGDSRQAKLEALSSLRLNSAAEHVCGVMQHGEHGFVGRPVLVVEVDPSLIAADGVPCYRLDDRSLLGNLSAM